MPITPPDPGFIGRLLEIFALLGFGTAVSWPTLKRRVPSAPCAPPRQPKP